MNLDVSLWTVFLAALITALATGLGAIPFAFVRQFSDKWLSLSNAMAAGLCAPSVAFAVADGLADSPPAAFDLVVCNPPFHQDRTVGDMLAWRMFTQAGRGLVAGGRLLVVGNRGLGHGQRLGRIFGDVEQLEAGEAVEVLEAVRR